VTATVLRMELHDLPVPKGRARSTKAGRHYTPAPTRLAEAAVRAAWWSQVGVSAAPYGGPVQVEVVATFPVPASWPVWKRSLAERGLWPHTSRPDLDNLVKLLTDALNGVAWKDDSQIVRIVGVKQYGPRPSTLATVTLLPLPARQTKGSPS